MIQKLLMLFLLLVCCLCQAQNKYVLTADSKKKGLSSKKVWL